MALNRSDKSRILRRYFPGMTRNSEMSTEPNTKATMTANPTRYSIALNSHWLLHNKRTFLRGVPTRGSSALRRRPTNTLI